jgi:hypothetical protein
LAEAGRAGWTPEQMRFEVQRRHPTRRHGIGGRPRRKRKSFGAEVTLRELERLSRSWLDFHSSVWSEVKDRGWKGLVRNWPAGDRDKLRELLRDTQQALGRLATACQEARATVAGLLPQA